LSKRKPLRAEKHGELAGGKQKSKTMVRYFFFLVAVRFLRVALLFFLVAFL
jgi:hypothetical protein